MRIAALKLESYVKLRASYRVLPNTDGLQDFNINAAVAGGPIVAFCKSMSEYFGMDIHKATFFGRRPKKDALYLENPTCLDDDLIFDAVKQPQRE